MTNFLNNFYTILGRNSNLPISPSCPGLDQLNPATSSNWINSGPSSLADLSPSNLSPDQSDSLLISNPANLNVSSDLASSNPYGPFSFMINQSFTPRMLEDNSYCYLNRFYPGFPNTELEAMVLSRKNRMINQFNGDDQNSLESSVKTSSTIGRTPSMDCEENEDEEIRQKREKNRLVMRF